MRPLWFSGRVLDSRVEGWDCSGASYIKFHLIRPSRSCPNLDFIEKKSGLKTATFHFYFLGAKKLLHIFDEKKNYKIDIEKKHCPENVQCHRTNNFGVLPWYTQQKVMCLFDRNCKVSGQINLLFWNNTRCKKQSYKFIKNGYKVKVKLCYVTSQEQTGSIFIWSELWSITGQILVWYQYDTYYRKQGYKSLAFDNFLTHGR